MFFLLRGYISARDKLVIHGKEKVDGCSVTRLVRYRLESCLIQAAENILAVTTTRSDKKIKFRVAGPDQVDDVLGVLDEVAAWLRAQGITQWPARFESSWVENAIHRGETWLVEVDGTISATVTVDWSDPVWSDAGGSAAYLHRMAVRRQAPGLGAVILAWAADVARQQGRDALRLDCVASNDRLRVYYEAAGFVHRGDVAVAGAPGQRLDTGPATRVSRYELRLDNTTSG